MCLAGPSKSSVFMLSGRSLSSKAKQGRAAPAELQPAPRPCSTDSSGGCSGPCMARAALNEQNKARRSWEHSSSGAQVSTACARSQVKYTYRSCSTPVILNCLTLWQHSNLSCFETQGPARYLKHGFVLKRMQAGSSPPGLRLCGCAHGCSRAVPQPLRAFPLPLGSDKMRSQPPNVPVLRKGTLEIASEIKEGIYPHDCSAEKAISIVC